MNPLIQAIAFAADKHRNQRRKDAEASQAKKLLGTLLGTFQKSSRESKKPSPKTGLTA